MLVEPPVFSRDEGLLDELGYGAERNVDAPHQLKPPHEAVVPVEDASALIGLEILDGARRRAAVEAARHQPHIGEIDR
ncbi:MAG TPA: hypothetical protein VN876_07005 [Gemmatimonadaceae bacterium]|nr:hypothetical protein [Gemmatimonadaceae bacterium]